MGPGAGWPGCTNGPGHALVNAGDGDAGSRSAGSPLRRRRDSPRPGPGRIRVHCPRTNPTLAQALASFDAAQSRSYQAGLYPNPFVGYVAEAIGALGEARPSSNGLIASGKASPGELQGGFVQQEIVTAGKLRLSRAKFAEEANAAQWQAVAQQFRVINGVRCQYFEVLAAQRLLQIGRELTRLNDEAVKTTDDLRNVGQANEPDLLQARVEARRARVALRNAENRYNSRWQSLVALVGAPEIGPTWLDDRPLEAEAGSIDFNATLAFLLEQSPEIHAAPAEIRRDQIMVRRGRASRSRMSSCRGPWATTGSSPRSPRTCRSAFPCRSSTATRGRCARRRPTWPATTRNTSGSRFAAPSPCRDAQSLPGCPGLGRGFPLRNSSLARRAYEIQSDNFRARRAAWPQVLVAQRHLYRAEPGVRRVVARPAAGGSRDPGNAPGRWP